MNSIDSNTAYLSALVLSDRAQERVIEPFVDLESVNSLKGDIVERINHAEKKCLSELDNMRNEAFATGFREGMQDALDKTSAMIARVSEYCSLHQQQIAGLVTKCTEKICGQLSPEVLVPEMVNHILNSELQDIQVVVRVHPEIARYLQEQEGVTVEPAPQLSHFDCEIETPDCIKDIGLQTQLTTLQRQFDLG